MRSFRSRSSGVFSMIGTTSSSKYFSQLVGDLRMPLIISWCVMRNSFWLSSVTMTAFCECVWITAPGQEAIILLLSAAEGKKRTGIA